MIKKWLARLWHTLMMLIIIYSGITLYTIRAEYEVKSCKDGCIAIKLDKKLMLESFGG